MAQLLTSREQERLDFFALEVLVKCLLAVQIEARPETEKIIAGVFAASVKQFAISGIGAKKVPECRDYMLQQGLQWISQAALPTRPNRKA